MVLLTADLLAVGLRPARAEVRVLPPVTSAVLGQTRRVVVYNEPTRMEDYRLGLRARRYLRFLRDELKPRIDQAYRTLPGSRQTAIMGSSMGGLFSAFAALARPDVFGQAASLLSAVFQFQGGALPRMVCHGAKQQPVRTPGDGGRWVRYLEEMRPILNRAGYVEGKDLTMRVIPGGRHNEVSWAARAGEVLRFLFPPTELRTQ